MEIRPQLCPEDSLLIYSFIIRLALSLSHLSIRYDFFSDALYHIATVKEGT